MSGVRRRFEIGLWHSRLVVLVAVIASLLIAAAVTWLVTVDVARLTGPLLQYSGLAEEAARYQARLDFIGAVVGIIDGYLLAAVLVVFALGLYGLFIGPLPGLEQSPVAGRLLRVSSIDDLKEKLSRVVVLILVVKFAQLALEQKYTSPLDVLSLALGLLLTGASLYLTSHRSKAGEAPAHGPA